MKRILGLVACTLLGACAEVGAGGGGWSEWQVVSVPESNLVVVADPDVNLPVAQIEQRANRSVEQEVWSWESGALFYARATQANTFFSSSFTRKSDLLDFWSRLGDIDLEVDDVRRGQNEIGHYAYALSDKNSAGLTCFTFSQSIPKNSLAYNSGGAGGFIKAYDCQPSEITGVAEMEGVMAGIVDRMKLR